jgi:hypothetical protein
MEGVTKVEPPRKLTRSFNTLSCWLRYYSKTLTMEKLRPRIEELYGEFTFETCQQFYWDHVLRNPEKYYH